MISAQRLRTLVGLVVSLGIVGSLGYLWWDSRLPATYSVMDLGEHDFGGGPRTGVTNGGPVGASAGGGGHEGQRGTHRGAADAGGAVSVADLHGGLDPQREPDVAVDLTARHGRVELASGRTVEGYSLNGTSPGPQITATVGDLVEVRLLNESVPGGVTLHWHGMDVPNAQDGVAGVTQDAVEVGERFTYRWVAPDAGTYWYHAHQMSHEQVAGGLLGGVLVHPRSRERGVRDVVAIAHLYEGEQTIDGRSGLRRVEGRPGERVRVRLVNTDNGPQVAWAGAPFLLRAVDGVDVRGPTEVVGRAVGIPAGGRVDLELRVPEDGNGVLVQLLGEVGLLLGPLGGQASAVPQPEDVVDLLTYGSAAPPGIDVTAADRSFEYSIGRRPGFHDGRPGMWWSVNGKLYPDLPMMTVSEGDVVRVKISNHSGQVHPMHLHGHHALVLSRDGVPATGSPWWFDSLDVRDGETFEVAFVADNPGIWMDHCHNLKHATEGLVTHLTYVGVTTPFLVGQDSGNTPE